MVYVISADEIKKGFPGYQPARAEEFHSKSTKLADRDFAIKLKDRSFKRVILLCGGSASGKTEFLETHLKNRKDCLILDATLSTKLGARIKLKKILEAKKKPVIYAVIPDDLKRAFKAFLNRDRKFSDTHFYKTHLGSRETLLWIAENYQFLEINVIESSYTKFRKLQFSKLKLDSRPLFISYLRGLQMTETDIIEESL